MDDQLPIGLAPGVRIRFKQRLGRRHAELIAPQLRQGPLQLDDFGASVVELLDGRMSPQQLLQSRTFRAPEDRQKARRVLDQLEQHGLVSRSIGMQQLAQEAEDERFWKLRWGQMRTVNAETLSDEQLDALTLEAPDSDCARCELHCCSYNVSISHPEVMTICKAAIVHDMRPRDIFKAPDEQPYGHLQLVALKQQEDKTCVFLDEDRRCILHASSGLEHKPLACQLYPGVPIVTDDGARLGLRIGCSHPKREASDEARATYRAMLGRIRAQARNLTLRQAPEQVVMSGARVVPWGEYRAWESETLKTLERAPDALAAMDVATDSVIEQWGGPEEQPGLALKMAGSLAGIFRDSDLTWEADALRRLAAGEGGAPKHLPADQASQLIQCLEPLRQQSVLAGLGLYRLLLSAAACADGLEERPRETAAGMFRAMEKRRVFVAVGSAHLGNLEALALASSYRQTGP